MEEVLSLIKMNLKWAIARRYIPKKLQTKEQFKWYRTGFVAFINEVLQQFGEEAEAIIEKIAEKMTDGIIDAMDLNFGFPGESFAYAVDAWLIGTNGIGSKFHLERPDETTAVFNHLTCPIYDAFAASGHYNCHIICIPNVRRLAQRYDPSADVEVIKFPNKESPCTKKLVHRVL